MDCEDTSGLFLLTDEKFDFDVSLSPASSKGDDDDEDEVFMGPVSYKERCVSVNVGSRLEDGGDGGGVQASWSPLSGDQLEAVCQEAHRLADQLQCGEVGQPQGKGDEPTDVTTDTTTEHVTDKDDFVQDAESKLCVLDQNATALIPIKRQTFCVQDSPMKHLPPTFQRRLLRGSSTNMASSTRPFSTASSSRHSTVSPASSTRTTTRHSASSPGVKPQTRTGLRGKAALSVVLPSKPAAATTSCSASKSRAEKTRLQPPSKPMGDWRQSPSSRPSSKAESCEDLLSDTASVASDISDSSLNSSLLGKRMLAPPTKSAVRNLSGVKAPSLQRSVTDRKHTSSSSSSVSSCNSSMSLSPAKGKPNSSLNRSLSGPTGPAPSNISRATAQSRPRRSTVYATAEPASSSAARRGSVSAQARKPSEAEGVKATRSTPLKRAQATPLQATPAKRVSLGGASIPTAAPARLQQSGLKAKSKAEAPILPKTSGGVRGPDVSKMLKPKRLTSVSSMDSLPQKPSAGPFTPSAGSCRSLQVKMRRPSALPTPVRRRMSAIPVTSPTGPPPTLARKERTCSPAPTDAQEVRPVDAPAIQPFRLEEEEEPPAAPPTCLPQPDQSENADPGVPSRGQSEPSRNLIELETIDSKRQEILLLDLPAPTLHPQEKLLIDLTNTPDLIRNSIKTCTTSQLIDLSSPLIKWSPEDKRGNNAPLINLSF